MPNFIAGAKTAGSRFYNWYREQGTAVRLILIFSAIAAVIQWLYLACNVGVLSHLDGWFWEFIDKQLYPGWIVLMVVVPIVAIGLLIRLRPRAYLLLPALIALGYTMQWGFALSEGRGIDGMRERMVDTGHAEFAKLAVLYQDSGKIVKNYEKMLERGKLGRYPLTKPPGYLLPYRATARMAGADSRKTDARIRLGRLVTFAAYTWPLVSCLVLIPLYFLCKKIGDYDMALAACTLYLCLPSFMLMTLHVDQVFLPAAAVTTVLAAVYAADRGSALIAFAAGVLLNVSTFISFSQIAVGPVVLIAGAGAIAAATKENGRRTMRSGVAFALGLAAGIVGCGLLFRFGLGYDFFARYSTAMDYHEAWKDWTPGLGTIAHFALVDTVDYLMWIGLGLAVGFFAGLGAALRKLSAGKINAANMLALSLVVVVAALLMFGKTKAETGRLWLFLAPFVCCTTALGLKEYFPRHNRKVLFFFVVLQIVTVIMIKRFQDFY